MSNLNRVAITSLIASVVMLTISIYLITQENKAPASRVGSKTDTVYLKPDIVYITDTMVIYRNDTALIRRCNDVHAQYQVAKLQLRDIENYVAICRRKPDQTKFLVGWITRRLR